MPIYYTKDWKDNKDINYYDEILITLDDGSKYIYMVPSEVVDMDVASDTIEGIIEYLSKYLDTTKITNIIIDDEEILVEELSYLSDVEEDGSVSDLGPSPVGKATEYPDEYDELEPDEDSVIDTDFLNDPEKVLVSTLQLVEDDIEESRRRRGYYTYKIRDGKKVKFFVPKIPLRKRKGYKRIFDKKKGRYVYKRIDPSTIIARRRAARKASTKRKRMLSLRKRKSLISSNRWIPGTK